MNIDQQITVKRMSQLKLYSSNLLCGLYSLMSNISYEYSVIYSICINIHTQKSLWLFAFDLSLSRLLSDYFTVGLIIERYTSTYFLSINEVSAKSMAMLEFGNFTAL